MTDENIEDYFDIRRACTGINIDNSPLVETRWQHKAIQNVDKWGLQDIATILMATQEELSEIGEELIDHVEGDDELVDLLAYVTGVGFEVQYIHETLYEDDDGEPLPEEERPELSFDAEAADLDRIEEEIHDTAALLVQLQAAVERARQEVDPPTCEECET